MKIALIGKGRVATHMSRALLKAGHDVTMCGGKSRTCPVPSDVEVVIISVKDDAISFVASEFADSSSLVLHTSGSISIEAIPATRRGVIYPMQTFSMDREVDFRQVPLFLETSLPEDMSVLSQLASTISDIHMPMKGEQRKILHLAAVFSCNFVNHLFEISHDVLAEHSIPFRILFPLIQETVSKIQTLTPHEAQTGPALRWDETVMQGHIEKLGDSKRRLIYQMLSESIRATHHKEETLQYHSHS
jgi:predicted short-subunit dehydrogenase-like oxidoreductase (DUF2520 family)